MTKIVSAEANILFLKLLAKFTMIVTSSNMTNGTENFGVSLTKIVNATALFFEATSRASYDYDL